MIKEFLDYRVSIKQLIAIALVVGVPYGIIGLIWALSTTEHLAGMDGIDATFSFIGEILAWPALVISDVALQ